MKDRCGVFICSCEGKLPLDRERLAQEEPAPHLSDHPREGAAAFADHARGERLEQVVISCCEGTAPFEAAFAAAGVSPEIHALDLKHLCYLPHPDADQANGKALRLVRAAVQAAQRSEEISENLLTAGNQLLLIVDDANGLRMAPRLQALGNLMVVVNAERDSVEGIPPGRVNWGRLLGISGRLGALEVRVATGAGNGERPAAERRLKADQVVIIAAKEAPAVKSRTGLHILVAPEEAELERVAADVAALTGTFMKPEHVRYDAAICAGGAASQQACGLCIGHCPYDAIARDADNPLRVRVDHLTCEGCGACVAACPTSALRFTEPSPAQLYDRLAGLLADQPEDDRSAALPSVVLFHCPEEGKAALRWAGQQALSYSPGVLPVEVPCLRYVSTANMLAAFRLGAAGVALLGCEQCPHGERALLLENLDLSREILDAFGLGEHRLRLLTAEPERRGEAIGALDEFARQLAPSPIRFAGRRYHGGGNRAVIAEALAAFLEQLETEPGSLTLKGDQPFALPEVNADGCTLCRACANVCPTHAFRFDEEPQRLSLKHIDCVACGLCETVCPEKVITLRRELHLNKEALEYQLIVQDEMVECARCHKPYINKRALKAVESRVLGLASLLDTFAGDRHEILRMCPDCRAVAAIRDVERGWEP